MYDVLRGGSFIPLHQYLKKTWFRNVVNDDDFCSKWSILASLHEFDCPHYRVSELNRYDNELNFTGIEFPVQLKDIKIFENLNPLISVSVYMFDENNKRIYSVRLTKNVKQHHVHLLMIRKLNNASGDNFSGGITMRLHYCWIRKFDSLVRSQITKSKNAIYVCDRCLQHFTSRIRLDEHIPYCMQRNQCNIIMPNKEKGEHLIRFKNYQHNLTVPFVIYADIESLLKTPEQEFCRSEFTTAYQQHKAYSVGYYLQCNFDESKSYYKFNRGEKCIDWYLQYIFPYVRLPYFRALEYFVVYHLF